MSEDKLASLFHNPAFPRSNAYDPQWVAENQMGPNVLWLAEWVTQKIGLSPGMRVLDMGCGRAMSSIFLAREFDVTVFATDLWIPAGENWMRVREARLENRVVPIHAEAHALPFAEGFFDAIIALDSYSYFGTDDLYLSYIIRFLRPGGQMGIVVPGLVAEFDDGPPDHLVEPQNNGKRFWEPDCWTFHTPQWWRRHWERSSLVQVDGAEIMPDGWKHWAQHERAVEAAGTGVFPSDEEALLKDAGRNIGLVRVTARRVEADPAAGKEGPSPHVWEPAFMGVCQQLRASTRRSQQ